jgi:putative transposase
MAGYNYQHCHSGIGLMTSDVVHHGRADAIHANRPRVLVNAYAAIPERFVRRPPRPPALPTAAWINQPTDKQTAAPSFLEDTVSSG